MPVDKLTNTKIFDGMDHLEDWTHMWGHNLVLSEHAVEEQVSGIRKDTTDHAEMELVCYTK